MDAIDILKRILTDGKVWAALWALVQSVVLYFNPEFPKDILLAANTFFLTIVAVISGAQGVQRQRAAKAEAMRLRKIGLD